MAFFSLLQQAKRNDEKKREREKLLETVFNEYLLNDEFEDWSLDWSVVKTKFNMVCPEADKNTLKRKLCDFIEGDPNDLEVVKKKFKEVFPIKYQVIKSNWKKQNAGRKLIFQNEEFHFLHADQNEFTKSLSLTAKVLVQKFGGNVRDDLPKNMLSRTVHVIAFGKFCEVIADSTDNTDIYKPSLIFESVEKEEFQELEPYKIKTHNEELKTVCEGECKNPECLNLAIRLGEISAHKSDEYAKTRGLDELVQEKEKVIKELQCENGSAKNLYNALQKEYHKEHVELRELKAKFTALQEHCSATKKEVKEVKDALQYNEVVHGDNSGTISYLENKIANMLKTFKVLHEDLTKKEAAVQKLQQTNDLLAQLDSSEDGRLIKEGLQTLQQTGIPVFGNYVCRHVGKVLMMLTLEKEYKKQIGETNLDEICRSIMQTSFVVKYNAAGAKTENKQKPSKFRRGCRKAWNSLSDEIHPWFSKEFITWFKAHFK